METEEQKPRSSDLPQEVVEHMDKLSQAEQAFIALVKQPGMACDGRWASIAITDIEKATMSARRAFAMANKS